MKPRAPDLPARTPLSIGALARRVGMAVSAIRYYESVGLIEPPQRRESGHRVYDQGATDVLVLIRHCRDLGFSVETTRELVALSSSPGRDCGEARTLAEAHLVAVRAKLAELRRLERSLARYVQVCGDTCAGGPAPECNILTDLRQGAAPSGCCA